MKNTRYAIVRTDDEKYFGGLTGQRNTTYEWNNSIQDLFALDDEAQVDMNGISDLEYWFNRLIQEGFKIAIVKVAKVELGRHLQFCDAWEDR